MPTLLHTRRHRREKNDYTKEPIVRWFAFLLILLATILIVRTVTADKVNETTNGVPPKEVGVNTSHPSAAVAIRKP